ncbi:exonuclease II Exo2, partial [Linderina macrospora]
MPSLKPRNGQETLELVHGLVPGSTTRARMRPGFPSLFTAPHTTNVCFNQTEIFGAPYTEVSMVLNMQCSNPLDHETTAADLAQELINGKRVKGTYRPRRLFVNWPYLHDAILVGVSDANGVYTIDAQGTNIIHINRSDPASHSHWKGKYTGAIYALKSHAAIDLSDTPQLLLHVLPLRSMKLYPDGSLMRDYGFPVNTHHSRSTTPWADVAVWDELGVVSTLAGMASFDLNGSWVNNPRFSEHEPLPIEKALPLKERVFFLARTPLYGSPGKVIGHSGDSAGNANGVDVQLLINTNERAAKGENFLGVNVLNHYHQAGYERYRPSYVVARELGITSLVLSRVTSKMLLLDAHASGKEARIHAGLDLKFEGKRLKVVGYTKRGANGWMYSDRAAELVWKYKQDFPLLFRELSANSDKSDMPDVREALLTRDQRSGSPKDVDNLVKAEVKRLKTWLNTNASRSVLVQVPIESDLLSREQIDSIAAERNAHHALHTSKAIVRNVRRDAVLRPADVFHRLMQQTLKVGHRVVFVADRDSSVPLGAKGYIVGIHARRSESPSTDRHSSRP